MARSSKLITACVALVACIALHSLAFLSGPAPVTQLRGSTPLEVAAGAAVPAVMMTPTAAMAADGEGMPSVVLGVGIPLHAGSFQRRLKRHQFDRDLRARLSAMRMPESVFHFFRALAIVHFACVSHRESAVQGTR